MAVSCVVRAGAALPPKPQSTHAAGLSLPFKYESTAEGTTRLKEASTVTENETPRTIMRRPAGVPGGQGRAGEVPCALRGNLARADPSTVEAVTRHRGGLWLRPVSAGGRRSSASRGSGRGHDHSPRGWEQALGDGPAERARLPAEREVANLFGAHCHTRGPTESPVGGGGACDAHVLLACHDSVSSTTQTPRPLSTWHRANRKTRIDSAPAEE